MTKNSIQIWLDGMKKTVDDDEHNHRMEDELRKLFIEHVINEPNDPELVEKAKMVLSTKDLDFARWCA